MPKGYLLLVLLFFAARQVSLSLIDGLLPNGGFEDFIGAQYIPYWETPKGFPEYVYPGETLDGMQIIVPEGRWGIRLWTDSTISTKVNVTKGKSYSITFSAARTCGQNDFVNVSVGGDSAMVPIQTIYSSLGWDMYSWAFVAEADQIVISLNNPSTDKAKMRCGPVVDTVALKTLPHPKRTRENKLKNGDFEEGPYIIPNTSIGVLIPPNIDDNHSPLPGWIIELSKAIKYLSSDHFTIPEGTRAVELVGGRESSIAQIARTLPGKTYYLSFLIGDANNDCKGNFAVEVYMGRDRVTVTYESKGMGGFEQVGIRFKAVSYQTRVRFMSSFYFVKSDHPGSLCGPVIDDVKLIGVRHSHSF